MVSLGDSRLGRELSRALAVRRAHFADEIHFSAPSFKHYRNAELPRPVGGRFRAVSITGRSCVLGCDHCRGILLESMIPAETPEKLEATGRELAARGCRGLLLSGGCDANGRVPLESFLPVAAELRRSLGLSIVVHTGLVDEDFASALADAGIDMVTLDLVGDAETAREVLHLEASPERFEQSLSNLVGAGLEVAPHLVVGLHRGEIRGEGRALEIASRYALSSLVLVIVRPEPTTPFRHVTPPTPESVASLMIEARLTLPTVPLYLGCARPIGHGGRALESYALRAGFNGIAFPSESTVRRARALGLTPTFVERCCALRR